MITKPSLINYSRISSVRQTTGTGLAQQQDIEVMNQLSEKYSLPIDSRAFSDVGRSAFKGSHLENDLGRLLKLITDGSIASGSIIVMFSLDRLSRQDLTKAVGLLIQIISQGVAIHTTIDNRLYKDGSSDLMASLMMALIAFAVANEESSKKSKRTIGAAQQRIQDFTDGKLTDTDRVRWIGVGKSPIWVSMDESKGIYANDVLKQVKHIVDLSLQGYGAARVSQIVNPIYGTSWESSGVTKLLRQESLFGRYRLKLNGIEHVLDNYYPPAITEDEFHQLRRIKTQRATRRGTKRFLPLLVGHGLFTHHQCNGAVRASRGTTGAVSYNCLDRSRGGNCCGFNAKATVVEKRVFNLISDMLHSQDSVNVEESPIPRLENELATKQSQLTELVELFDAGTLPTSMIGRMGQVQEGINNIQLQISEARNEPSNTMAYSEWFNIQQEHLETPIHSPERMRIRLLLSQIVKSIVIDKRTGSNDMVLGVILNDGRKRFAIYEGDTLIESSPTDIDLQEVMQLRGENIIKSVLQKALNKIK